MRPLCCRLSSARWSRRAAPRNGARQRELALINQRPRPAQGFVNDGVDIGLGLPSGDLLLVNLDRVAHRLFHAVKIEVPVASDPLGHFPNEALGDRTGARLRLGIVLHQQI